MENSKVKDYLFKTVSKGKGKPKLVVNTKVSTERETECASVWNWIVIEFLSVEGVR